MITPVMLGAVVVMTSIATALLALFVVSALPPRRGNRGGGALLSAPTQQSVFLFQDEELLDATRPARALLATLPGPGSEWTRLRRYLATRLPGFDEEFAEIEARGEIELGETRRDDLHLRAEWLGDVTRLTITDLRTEGQSVVMDALSYRAQEEELAFLRDLLAAAPVLVWKSDPAGAVVWANDAYFEFAIALNEGGADAMTWPLRVLFPEPPAATGTRSRRVKLAMPGDQTVRWFDCLSQASEDGRLHYALPADGVIKAEAALQEFIQTLSKTFAHLPIGLAIFDRQRRLALFNPALVDLTSLGTEFLSGRPTLFAFLDRLRDVQIVPEPKDYSSWRQKIMDLEMAASSGLYEETWTLPSGQTYNVTGRPHPDGAVAFLFEDVSAEVSLTRRFRSEIELGQAVVDTLEEAVAVFSPAGQLILSNAAYDVLWDVDTQLTLGTVTIIDALRVWQAKALPDPCLGDIRDFVTSLEDRAEWASEVGLKNGDLLGCRVVPLSGGSTLVVFRYQGHTDEEPRRARSVRRRLAGVDLSGGLNSDGDEPGGKPPAKGAVPSEAGVV